MKPFDTFLVDSSLKTYAFRLAKLKGEHLVVKSELLNEEGISYEFTKF